MLRKARPLLLDHTCGVLFANGDRAGAAHEIHALGDGRVVRPQLRAAKDRLEPGLVARGQSLQRAQHEIRHLALAQVAATAARAEPPVAEIHEVVHDLERHAERAPEIGAGRAQGVVRPGDDGRALGGGLDDGRGFLCVEQVQRVGHVAGNQLPQAPGGHGFRPVNILPLPEVRADEEPAQGFVKVELLGVGQPRVFAQQHQRHEIRGVRRVDGDVGAVAAVDAFRAAPRERVVLDVVDDQRGVVEEFGGDRDEPLVGRGRHAHGVEQEDAENRPPVLAAAADEVPERARDHGRLRGRVVGAPARVGPGIERRAVELARQEILDVAVDAADHAVEKIVQVQHVGVAVQLQAGRADNGSAARTPGHAARALPHGTDRREQRDFLVLGVRLEVQLQPRAGHGDAPTHRVARPGARARPPRERFEPHVAVDAVRSVGGHLDGVSAEGFAAALVAVDNDHPVAPVVELHAHPVPPENVLLLAAADEPPPAPPLVVEPRLPAHGRAARLAAQPHARVGHVIHRAAAGHLDPGQLDARALGRQPQRDRHPRAGLVEFEHEAVRLLPQFEIHPLDTQRACADARGARRDGDLLRRAILLDLGDHGRHGQRVEPGRRGKFGGLDEERGGGGFDAGERAVRARGGIQHGDDQRERVARREPAPLQRVTEKRHHELALPDPFSLETPLHEPPFHRLALPRRLVGRPARGLAFDLHNSRPV